MKEIIKNNIISAINSNNLNAKVMPNDHVVTDQERMKYIFPYDNRKMKWMNKIKYVLATMIVNQITKRVNKDTKIYGLENLTGISLDAAIITVNHFSPVDSTIVKHLTNRLGKNHQLSIVVAETNIFMKGNLGWLLRHVNTMPFTHDVRYIERNFNPALEYKIKNHHFILFYPEQEMWLDYKKPRPLKSGAYHYATKYHIPIIPLFITMEKEDENIKYSIHISKPLFPDANEPLKKNKQWLMEQDFGFKKACYESFYAKKLDYTFSNEDIL